MASKVTHARNRKKIDEMSVDGFIGGVLKLTCSLCLLISLAGG